ncbi:hypothetical protein MS3_00003509 [Schistosoma haematobium]|uniref:Protoporphyrinogen oxidase n=1 Tax=Schistosoma haematobium TaxID=6185 RepID=A0A095AIW4_SCHHA|nr:hypothetical protein MS3_00003509 [Schistosoma haematobium]KAH9591094.1 hypothetical protein MS3_00003509 [Schistosoma haematobium]CAH8665759.1 unnamed protein product [Schistosoma haematobium]CAH8672742.1 unnamed protein product [Schistosoma haematobium]
MCIPHYLIVGGGLSGLVTSYLISLTRPLGSYRLTVLESNSRWGGWIQSVKNMDTGSIYEIGPHSARAKSATSGLLMRIVKSLHLENSLVWMRQGTDEAKRLIYINGQLLPLSAFNFSTLKPLTRSNCSLIIRRLFSRRPPSQSDWTVDEFLRSRFDSEFADYFGSALMRGIFAGDSRNLSARACLPTMVKSEEYGPNLILGILLSSINRSLDRIVIPNMIDDKLPQLNNLVPSDAIAWTLSGGLETLINTIVDHLSRKHPHIDLKLNSSVEKLKSLNGCFEYTYKVIGDNGNDKEKNTADIVFFCCPSFITASILENILTTETLSYLKPDSIPWGSIVSAVLEIDDSFTPLVRGFGHLVPRTEDEHILGVIYDSFAFPKLDGFNKNLRYTVMMKPFREWLEASTSLGSSEHLKNTIEEVAKTVLINHLKIPAPVIVGRHISILRNCIPQYPPGHLTNMANLRNGIRRISNGHSSGRSGIYLVGNSYDGVGLNHVVYSAACAVAEEFSSSS